MFIEIQNLTKKYKKEKFWQNTETLNRIGVINYYSRRDRHANTHTCTHTDNAVTLGGKGRGWHYHSKYIEQSSYSYLLSLHWTNRCQVTVIASWQAYKSTAVSWHLFAFLHTEKRAKAILPFVSNIAFPTFPFKRTNWLLLMKNALFLVKFILAQTLVM